MGACPAKAWVSTLNVLPLTLQVGEERHIPDALSPTEPDHMSEGWG